MNLDTAQNVFSDVLSDVDGIYSEQDKREAVECVFDCIRDLRARVEALESAGEAPESSYPGHGNVCDTCGMVCDESG